MRTGGHHGGGDYLMVGSDTFSRAVCGNCGGKIWYPLDSMRARWSVSYFLSFSIRLAPYLFLSITVLNEQLIDGELTWLFYCLYDIGGFVCFCVLCAFVYM